MNDDGALEQHSWGGYYRSPPLKGGLGLQLISDFGERITKPFLFDGSAGSYLHGECGITEPSFMPMGYARDVWYQNNIDGGKMLHVFTGNHLQHSSCYGALVHGAAACAAGTSAHTLQMLQPLVTSKEEALSVVEDSGAQQDAVPLKKRSKGQGPPFKASKPKRSKKAIAPRERSGKSPRKARSGMKSLDMVINGLDLDLSGMPAPLCTCTGHPQQCYRWGAGGWQSACCTTSICMYPLPMSMKRRGARIAGRKMSQGAFKKVLEKFAGEGHDFRSPIDLKTFWAKHGTNKFVTIR